MIERNRIFIELAFFIGFLIIGLKIYDNYGVHTDEYHINNLDTNGFSTFIKLYRMDILQKSRRI